MTQQNVVLPDAVPLPAQPSTGAPNPSSLYSSRRPPRGRVVSASSGRRSFLRQLDVTAAAGRMGAWVEAMKASSPTHVAGNMATDSSGWMNQHPSALDMFEEIAGLARGKQVAIFLDYDGTLSPIVDDPDKAFMTPQMRDAVRSVAGCFPTAIVTGRSVEKVVGFVQLAELYYAGSHGMDIKGPSHDKGATEVLFQPASRFIPMINKMHSLLVKATRGIPGAKVENNKFCLSVHFRRVDEKLWGRLEEQVRQLVVEFPDLRLTRGRKVLEIRPVIEWDKGKALLFLLNTLGFANRPDILPIYIGDDRTDEDAFKVLRDMGRGFGIVVSKIPKETNASYTLQEPSEVMEFLCRLVASKCQKQPQMAR